MGSIVVVIFGLRPKLPPQTTSATEIAKDPIYNEYIERYFIGTIDQWIPDNCNERCLGNYTFRALEFGAGMDERISVVGGGLAGSEAAWQIAERCHQVDLYEMRPDKQTGVHTSEYLAELVCSNSLGSFLNDRAPGVLKEEIRRMGSLVLACAERTALPAGGALAVDRDQFSRLVTEKINQHPNIKVIRAEMQSIPNGPAIIASGPLTSSALAEAIQRLTGSDQLYFFDAIAPIVSAETVNMQIAYRASRYDRGDQETGDYINCPLNQDEYNQFVDELLAAERIELKHLSRFWNKV